MFHQVKWREQHSSDLLFTSTEDMIATKRISVLLPGAAKEVKYRGKSHVDESRAVLLNGGAAEGPSHEVAITPSDDEADGVGLLDGDSSSADEEDDVGIDAHEHAAALANGVCASDSDAPEVETNEVAQISRPKVSEQDNNAEPSFGDLVAARRAKPISIAEAFPSVDMGAAAGVAVIPTGISLTTVLTQALRTNDNNLLESCFHNTDTQIIRSTIQRIDSSLAGILIQSLAERLSSRPGRYGHLLVWVQWLCVAHGAAIGGRPEVVNKIKTLYKVLNQRSKALDPLLLLKGKLDMLDAQLELRKQLSADRGRVNDADADHVVYIEGEEDDENNDEDEVMSDIDQRRSPRRNRSKQSLDDFSADGADESEDDEDMPMTNGVIAETEISNTDSDDDDEGPLQQHEGDLVDEEAEESDDNSHPSDRENVESEDEGGSDDDEDSDMDGFIDDGPIEEIESPSELSVDDTPEKPPAKRKRREY